MENAIKRVDLNLRGAFSIDTSIYKIGEDSYEIYCPNLSVEEFEEISLHFQKKIRPIGMLIKLVGEIPSNYISQIKPLAESEIPKGFAGIPMSIVDLYNIILAKFPQINFYKIDQSKWPIKIHVYEFIEKTEMGTTIHHIGTKNQEKLQDFLDGLDMGTGFEIVLDRVTEIPALDRGMQHNPVQYLHAAKLTPMAQQFSQRDEAIWFDNIEAIFQRKIKKKDLYFFDPNDYCSYADFTSATHIDIRNFLFLYKTVFLTPPYDTDIIGWLHSQHITEDEFLELADKGRIKLLLTQPEFRYRDNGFFSAIYQVNKSAIVTRRALAALQQMDIIEMADNYALKGLEYHPDLIKLCGLIAQQHGSDASDLHKLLTWPMRALRGSFESLHFGGLLGASNFGVNEISEKLARQRLDRDLSFEFTITAPNIHLSHALNATYYPENRPDSFSDQYYAHVMGGYLNMFKNASFQNLALLDKDQGLEPAHRIRLDPLEVIEIDNYVPILEFEQVLAEAGAYPKGKALMETLAGLNSEQRSKKISQYNQAVEKKLKKGKYKAGAIDLGTNILMDGAGAISDFAGLGTAVSVAKLAGKGILETMPEIGQAIESTIESLRDSDASNIHFLTKVNRVARVKRF